MAPVFSSSSTKMHMEQIFKQWGSANIVGIKIFYTSWFIVEEVLLCFLFEGGIDKILKFNVIHFPYFELSAAAKSFEIK